ncbi:MAG: hypothetical protein U1F43_22085 [Myxococcota bacterium]
MRSLPLLAACLVSACCSTSAPPAPQPEAEPHALVAPPHRDGGISAEQAFPPEVMALGHGYSIVVLTVVATDARGTATNDAPPHIVVRIDEVLAGEAAPGERPGQWSPPPSGVDWSGPSAQAAKAEWARRPLEAPPVGLRILALGRDVDGTFRVSARLRDAYSDAGRAELVERIARERARRQAP